MKRIAMVAVMVMCSAGLAHGQIVGLFADKTGSGCSIDDSQPGVVSIYVVGMVVEATAFSFSAPKPSCFDATYVGDSNEFPVTIGNSQAGYSVGLGTCVKGPVHFVTMHFGATGNSGSCCLYEIKENPHLFTGEVEYVDCAFDLHLATRSHLMVNPDHFCRCTAGGAPVPVQESTWGGIKALYE